MRTAIQQFHLAVPQVESIRNRIRNHKFEFEKQQHDLPSTFLVCHWYVEYTKTKNRVNLILRTLRTIIMHIAHTNNHNTHDVNSLTL